MAPDLVKARWNGPFAAQAGPGHILQAGDEYEITPEDLKSDHWTPVGAAAKRAEKDAES